MYTGRDIKTSRAGLAITQAEWQANLQHATAALEIYGVTLREKQEFPAIFRGIGTISSRSPEAAQGAVPTAVADGLALEVPQFGLVADS